MSESASALESRGCAGEHPQEIVRRRFGLLTHDHQRAGFERTVEHLTRVLGYRSRDEYVEALAHVQRGAPEIERLLSAITVGESYFFRDRAHLEFIEKRWLPDIIRRKGQRERCIRVWSAGCSLGQEIYTVAMLLDRYLPERQSWDLQLIGTDINREALQAAEAGRYRKWSLRTTPEWARRRYFELHEPECLLIPRILSLARFECFNLVEDCYPWGPADVHGFDLILCRNVFIYLDRSAIGRVMSSFARRLDSHGVLLLGPADIVSEDCRELRLESWNRAQYYRRACAGEHDPVRSPVPPPVRLAVPPPRGVAPGPGPLTGGPAPAATPCQCDVEEVEALLAGSAWEAAARAADAWLSRHGEEAHMLVRAARAKASLGRLGEALEAAQRSLALEPLRRDAHLILALVLMERDEPDAAESALRRAIYLDSGFLDAHYHLGSLLLRQGRRAAGERCLRNCMEIACRSAHGDSASPVPGLTIAELVESLRQELAGNAVPCSGGWS